MHPSPLIELQYHNHKSLYKSHTDSASLLEYGDSQTQVDEAFFMESRERFFLRLFVRAKIWIVWRFVSLAGEPADRNMISIKTLLKKL